MHGVLDRWKEEVPDCKLPRYLEKKDGKVCGKCHRTILGRGIKYRQLCGFKTESHLIKQQFTPSTSSPSLPSLNNSAPTPAARRLDIINLLTLHKNIEQGLDKGTIVIITIPSTEVKEDEMEMCPC